MINKAILVGNVGRDPEFKTLSNGKQYARFSLATSEGWKDKGTGERKTKSQWHKIVVWNDTNIEIVKQHVRKGSKLYVEGQFTTREWDDNGIKKYLTEVNVKGFNHQIIPLDVVSSNYEETPNSTYEEDETLW